MWRFLGLILPVLVPSWRFFRTVEASPRVQWALIPRSEGQVLDWQEVHPRAQRTSSGEMLWRLFWNPARNEALYLVTCAERLQQAPSLEIFSEIRRRVVRDISRHRIDRVEREALYRLVFVQDQDGELVEEEVFRSDAFPALVGTSR